MSKPVVSNEMVYFIQKFKEEMEDNGFSLLPIEDKWMPRTIAHKDNHYTIEADCRLDPSRPSFSVSGYVGSDMNNVFYFNISSPFTDHVERFDKMMMAMEPFIKKELNSSSISMSF